VRGLGYSEERIFSLNIAILSGKDERIASLVAELVNLTLIFSSRPTSIIAAKRATTDPNCHGDDSGSVKIGLVDGSRPGGNITNTTRVN
jgi:hypothetical protein